MENKFCLHFEQKAKGSRNLRECEGNFRNTRRDRAQILNGLSVNTTIYTYKYL